VKELVDGKAKPCHDDPVWMGAAPHGGMPC
jgi:hypothetical protein